MKAFRILVAVTVVSGVALGALMAWVLAPDGGPGEIELQLDYPIVENTADGDIEVMELGELVRAADLVVICTVRRLEAYEKDASGNPDLTAVDTVYTLDVEEYLKGSGASTLEFRKTVAYESRLQEAAYVLESSKLLDEGVRYIMALRYSELGVVTGAGEPFRFRLADGSAYPESTIDELQEADLADFGFEVKPEEDVKGEIAAETSTARSDR